MSYARDRNIEREAVTDERGCLEMPYGAVWETDVQPGEDQFRCKSPTGEFQSVSYREARYWATVHHAGSHPRRARRTRAHAARPGQASEIMPRRRRRSLRILALSSIPPAGAIDKCSLPGSGARFAGPCRHWENHNLEAIRYGAEQNGYAVEGFAHIQAARQLREAGVPADTLQGFLARCGQQYAAADPSNKHLYMVDESSSG